MAMKFGGVHESSVSCTEAIDYEHEHHDVEHEHEENEETELARAPEPDLCGFTMEAQLSVLGDGNRYRKKVSASNCKGVSMRWATSMASSAQSG